MKKEHSPKCDVVKYPTIAQACTCHKHPPVAPAPTASAREWLKTYMTANLGEYVRLPIYEGERIDWKEDAIVRLLEAYASSQSSKLAAQSAEVERLSKEIENLIWNLGGCDTIASGWSKPFDYNKEMARPALDSVSRLATKLEAAESKLSQLQQQILKYENDEASCCPEDVGFVEFIGVQRKKIESLQLANEEKARKIYGLLHFDDITGMVDEWPTADGILAILNGGQQ